MTWRCHTRGVIGLGRGDGTDGTRRDGWTDGERDERRRRETRRDTRQADRERGEWTTESRRGTRRADDGEWTTERRDEGRDRRGRDAMSGETAESSCGRTMDVVDERARQHRQRRCRRCSLSLSLSSCRSVVVVVVIVIMSVRHRRRRCRRCRAVFRVEYNWVSEILNRVNKNVPEDRVVEAPPAWPYSASLGVVTRLRRVSSLVWVESSLICHTVTRCHAVLSSVLHV